MAKSRVVLKSKLDTRGGHRTRIKSPSPYSLLIEAIWNRLGGPSFIAKCLGVNVQCPVNWKVRGAVPLEQIQHVSDTLGVSKWALNYGGCIKIYRNEKIPPWREVIKDLNLFPPVQDKLIKEFEKHFKGKK